MKKILYLLSFCTALFFSAVAQAVPDPTNWQYEVRKKADGEYELVFKVELTDGWHIFSQNPGDDFLIPTSFEFAKNNDVKLIGKVEERGKLKKERMDGIDNEVNYYEGKVEFIQVVRAKPGTRISGEHEYQVCNDRMCLPPKKKNFEFVLKN